MTPLPEMALVPGGTFLMGRENSRPDERPAHEVTVAPFFAALRPVSNAEYARFVAATDHDGPPFLDDPRFQGDRKPVVGISWFDAVAYCEWLSAATSAPFRLPTEAEREFAALGGLPGGDWPWPGQQHPAIAEIDAFDRPHEPLPACANGYGLYCMAENVHEWCSDWYSATYYAESPRESPSGPLSGIRRASRGGSWRHREKVTRVNARSSIPPQFRYSDYGFRVYGDA